MYICVIVCVCYCRYIVTLTIQVTTYRNCCPSLRSNQPLNLVLETNKQIKLKTVNHWLSDTWHSLYITSRYHTSMGPICCHVQQKITWNQERQASFGCKANEAVTQNHFIGIKKRIKPKLLHVFPKFFLVVLILFHLV